MTKSLPRVTSSPMRSRFSLLDGMTAVERVAGEQKGRQALFRTGMSASGSP